MVIFNSVAVALLTGQASSLSVTTFSEATVLNPLPAMVTIVVLGPLLGERPLMSRADSGSSFLQAANNKRHKPINKNLIFMEKTGLNKKIRQR
jgi:hypothetical protein